MARTSAAKRRKKEKRKKLLKKLIVMAMVIFVLIFAKWFASYYEDKKVMENVASVETPSWIEQQLLDEDRKSRPETKLDAINDIVIHYVANPGSSAEANRNYFNKPDTTVSAHFVVGLDGEIIQCIPLTEQSYASNWRNNDSIAIEVCHPDASGKFSYKTMMSLIRLTSWLTDLCRLNMNHIIRHYDITGKMCPKYYVENEDAWDEFRLNVSRAQ